MNWISLNSLEQLEAIKNSPDYSILFKHSTRCSVSRMAIKNLELDANNLPENVPVYYLDLLAYRDISNKIAEDFKVHHESPQLLLIKNGECIYEASHSEISVAETLQQMNLATN